MCCLTSKEQEVLNILQCSGKWLDSYQVYYRTSGRFSYRYQVQDALDYLVRVGYVKRAYGSYAAACCAPVVCCSPSVVVVEKKVYVPVVAVQIPTPVAIPKKSYTQYLIECQQQYVIPKSAEEYLKG